MTLSASDKEFVALGAAIGAGCHPCTQYHTQAALKAGLSAEEILGALEEAQEVRARGGVAVANVGRRILGLDQQELGAAAGCNSGALLLGYAEEATRAGLDGAELREAVDIAEMVKTQAGKFLSRDVERVLEREPEPVGAAAVGCCAPESSTEPAAAAGEATSPCS